MTSTIDSSQAIAPMIDPQRLPRLLTATPISELDAHLDRYGPLARPSDLIEEVRRSGLRGRGGAGFPTGVKMAAVAAGRRSVVVANGTEGEPASSKDKALLTRAPHLVLDGAIAAARAVGAREVVVCVDRRAPRVVAAVDAAVAQRHDARRDRIEIRVAAAPDRYVSGEESALVRWLNGGEAKPTFVPPRPFERGVHGRPTLVDNVETLAHVALVARYGADWFRAIGTAADPGSLLVTVAGPAEGRLVREAAFGAPLSAVLGRDAAAVDAPVLVGGYFGTWIDGSEVPGLTLDSASLATVGASLGAGVIAQLPSRAHACGLAESARVTRWLAGQNAGQCGPCVFGLDAIAGAMEQLVRGGRGDRAQRDLGRWLEMVKGRGACKHPDGAARFVESTLRVFADEIERHRRHGPCRASTSSPPVLPCPTTGGWR